VTPTTPPANGARTALCIGIDAYPDPQTLFGCVNDSREWGTLFQALGFTVTSLHNDAATRSAITDTLALHVRQLRAGDIFLLQYAGHGTQFPDDTGDEPDGKDEALCPVDMMTAGFIRDDEIRTIMNRIPDGARVIAFIDCCHSSSMARAAGRPAIPPGSRARAITPTPAMVEVHQRTRKGGRAKKPQSRRDIVFAACRDDQLAFETEDHGDFTRLVIPLIKERAEGVTNAAMQSLIIAAFGNAARQNPTLDCDPLDENHSFLQP